MRTDRCSEVRLERRALDGARAAACVRGGFELAALPSVLDPAMLMRALPDLLTVAEAPSPKGSVQSAPAENGDAISFAHEWPPTCIEESLYVVTPMRQGRSALSSRDSRPPRTDGRNVDVQTTP